MWTTPDLFRVIAAAQAILLGAVLVRDHREDSSARASLWLLLASFAHMLLPLLRARELAPPLVHVFAIVGSGVPFAFWFLTKVHFDDEPRFRASHLGLLAGLLTTCYVGFLVGDGLLPAAEPARVLWGVLPRALGIALVVHALINVYVGTRSDLVVQRLKLRYGVLGVVGTYVLVELLAEAVVAGRHVAIAEDLHGVTGGLLLVGLGFFIFRVQPEILRPARLPADPRPALDPQLVDRLRQLLEVEQVFREEGLTVASLAQRLGTQEHRVRALINSHLGFRNFNAFLHDYRVREARNSLADPTQRHKSVSEIAFAVGYASLGPFNRAFKELTGSTPTEFRASLEGRSLADSGIGELSTGKQRDG